MNRIKLTFIFSFICLIISAQENKLPEGYPRTDRTKTNLDNGWSFHLGETTGNPLASDFDESDWEKVSVSHSLKLVFYNLHSIKETLVQKCFCEILAGTARP